MLSTPCAAKSSQRLFALVDCNNFYASCEKAFRPDLKYRPVVVLSNNDGCIIARSAEAKALGYKMGEPAFKVSTRLRQDGVMVFSSNYALYADMSNRVMTLLEVLAPKVEVYSIDEAFLDLAGMQKNVDLTQYGLDIRQHVQKCTGITVCVGIAPTKTLAKLANYAAKKYPATGGAVDLSTRSRQQRLLHLVPVNEVWGIGRKLTARLYTMGITTALQLARADLKSIRRQFSVMLERTVRELNGESCLELEEVAPTKKQIVCSRSFGERVTELQLMREAVASYTVRAAEKLRGEGQSARSLNLFIRTSPFATSSPFYGNNATHTLIEPTNDTRVLLAATARLLTQLWRPGYAYAKAGVMLSDFYQPGVFQPQLFDQSCNRPNSQKLMHLVDAVNRRSPGSLRFAGQGNGTGWAMQRNHLSPAYTTRWQELPRVV